MNLVRFEKTARRELDRAPARVTDLVDESSDYLRHKLDEAVDLIRGAAAQLAEEGESLIKANAHRAAVLAEQGRQQAKVVGDRARKAAAEKAEESYADLTALAGRSPLSVVAVAAGIGLTIGVAMTLGMILRARREADTRALDQSHEAVTAREAASVARRAPRVRKPAKPQAARPTAH
ncbi:MAG TPA: hypothetical protein VMU59_07215 [Caulobacteraceae bacterium]|nr:hypothetical protein [Caulobacteraceae bacterium]